jgi:hypothetical protein
MSAGEHEAWKYNLQDLCTAADLVAQAEAIEDLVVEAFMW